MIHAQHNRSDARCSALLLGVLLVASGCDSRSDRDATYAGVAAPATSAQAATPPAATTGPTADAPTAVEIDNFTFRPQSITIKPGTTVVWTNHDDVPHTATSSDLPSSFDSRTLDTGDTYRFTFTKPGTFAYYCKVHPHMTGTVVVK